MRWSLGLGPVGAALLLAASLPLADGSGWLSGIQTAAAQNAPQGRKASSKRPVAKAKSKGAASNTDQQLDAAAKSIAEGNADAAMSTLEGILSGGGLANKHMARALYLRGVAHRRKARPAQAIADLTSATWLKDGLSDADRAAAFKERAEISREIGVADAGASPAAVSAVPAPAPAPATRFVQAPAAPTGLVRRPPPVGQPGLTEGGFPRVTQTPSPPPPVAETSRAPAARTASVARPPPAATDRGFAPIVTPAPQRPAPPPRAAVEPLPRPQPVAQTARAPAASGPSERGFTPIVTAAPQRPAPPPRVAPEPRAEPQTAPRTEPVVQPSPAPTPAAQTSLVRRPPPVGVPGLSEGGFPRVAAAEPPRASPPPRARSGDGPVPDAATATSSWQNETRSKLPYGWVSAEERQKARAATPAAGDSPYSGGGVGEFFSGLLGVAPGSSPPPERVASSAEEPTWSTAVREPAPGRVAEKPPQRSAAVVTGAVPPRSNAAQGAYRLQIALVRNRSEANALAARVRKEHGRVFGARKLEVDETIVGNMGTFYRVRLGPFAAVDESKALCDQLRTQGYDCLVVTQ